ncbi:HAD family phosphatase [Dactylosporangium vinaceum]|uniref:HAD family hydrolase n=1 Tax=Dactylosporangium vinaceum TaxID=53362 RepID=A0ABV5M3F6_9ACTN|nr:HAD family hydrolase [Dactylosporangium vinaceum]UAB99699.1 HAD family phosphatase [Dactylosporangium vinaceum]
MADFDAVVTDLDGTVIRRDGTISDATLRAARALQHDGVPLIAATARTPAGVDALHTLAPFLTLAVCCSGAVGYIPATAALAWYEPIPRDVVTDLAAFLEQRWPSAGLAAYDGRQWWMTSTYQMLYPSRHKGRTAVVPAATIVAVDPCAMAVCHPERNSPQLIAALHEAGFGATRLVLHHAGPAVVDVTAPAVDKASGVLRALARLGVAPQRVIGFGDMPIDIAMFSAVGHSVAMSNAPDEVRRAATSQTASVEDDGFARTLCDVGLIPCGARLGSTR